MIVSNCKWCAKEIRRGGDKPGVFCSRRCKGDWQMEQKPVDYDWLYEKYLDDGLSTYSIAKLVNRNPKQVWNWLKGYGIPTREREWDTTKIEGVIQSHIRPSQPYHDKEWLEEEYILQERSASDIADQCGVTENNILYFLHKFGIPVRTMKDVREIKYWGQVGEDNPMYGRRGEDVPSWKGGVTTERQAFYSSQEWKDVVKLVYARDKSICRRCLVKPTIVSHHIHHIVSFAVKGLRCDLDNLILLCNPCHKFVHSNANVAKEYIMELPS